jgi:hypothetical protein
MGVGHEILTARSTPVGSKSTTDLPHPSIQLRNYQFDMLWETAMTTLTTLPAVH